MSATPTALVDRRCAFSCSSWTGDLGDFLAVLDRWNLDYAVALTADHGGLDIPERLRLHGVADAARIDPALTPKAVGDADGQGDRDPRAQSSPISGWPAEIIYLDSHLLGAPTGSARWRRRWQSIVRTRRSQPLSRKTRLRARRCRRAIRWTWPLIQRVRASFDPRASGDLSWWCSSATSCRLPTRRALCRDARQPVGL